MTARDSTTKRIVPDPNKFPNGLGALATQIHNLGLKIGIYRYFLSLSRMSSFGAKLTTGPAAPTQ